MNESKSSRGLLWGLSALAGLLLFSASGTARAQEPADRVGDTRDVLGRYVETRRILSKERRDWAVGREVLQDRIGVVRREIETLDSRVTDAQKSIAEADKKREELVAENERLASSSSSLVGTVAKLEARTRELLPRLPDPVRERVKPFSQRLPEADAEEVKLSLGERFQNVVAILNEVDKLNREVTVWSEVREIGDGQTAEVTSMYVGLGQGYYVTGDGTAAGVGTATADAWVWQPANEFAPAIAKAIAIHKNEKPAEFVRLPIALQAVAKK